MRREEVSSQSLAEHVSSSSNPLNVYPHVRRAPYLGITTYSYMETLIGKGTHEKTPELERLIDSGMSYLRQAVDLYGDQEGLEVRSTLSPQSNSGTITHPHTYALFHSDRGIR